MFDFIGDIAGKIFGIPGAIGGIMGVVGLIVGSGGLFMLIKTLIKEMIEAVEAIKFFINKYNKYFISGQGKSDYLLMTKELDEALESLANVLDKLKLTSYAKQLREVIELPLG